MFGYTFYLFIYFFAFFPKGKHSRLPFPSLDDEAILKVGLLFKKALE